MVSTVTVPPSFFAKLKRRLQRKQIIRIGAGLSRKALHRAGFRINIDPCACRDKKL